MDLHAAPATRNLPGVPPPSFEEWEGGTEYTYGDERSTLANDFQPAASDKTMLSHSLYGGAEFALFGSQYGISIQTNEINTTNQRQPIILRAQAPDPYEDMLCQADVEIQRAYADSQDASGMIDVEVEFE